MRHVKITVFLIITIFLFLNSNVQATTDILEEQKNLFNISDFLKEANTYSKEAFPEIDMAEVLNTAIKGEIKGDFWYKIISTALGKETVTAIRSLGIVLAIIVIHSILNSISEGLENKSIAQVTYYAQYVLIVTLIMTSFTEMIELVKNTIENLVGFMNCLTPILISLMITTGSITTANIIQPVILFIIGFIGNVIITLILPALLVATVLGIVSNLSDKIQIDKLSKYFKSSIAWILGVVLTVFVGLVSIEGTLSSSVDGITAKTAKAAVSNFIPVVGKILGDAVDAVLGCATVLKNAVGIVGVLVVIGICILPIIKLSVLTIAYHLATAMCEIIADKKITKLLEQMAGSFKILLAMLFSVSTMLIIGVTLTLKISNSRTNVQIRRNEMLKNIGNWASSIAITVIIVTILEMLLPEGKNKKYIKTVLGIFLLFTVISPVIKLATDEKISLDQIVSASQTQTINNTNTNPSSKISDIFITNAKKDISDRLYEKGYIVSDIKIKAEIQDDASYAKIQEILITLRESNDKSEETETIESVKISIGDTGLKKELSTQKAISDEEKEKIIKYLSSIYDVPEEKISLEEG